MFNPPTHIRARTEYNISTRTLIALSLVLGWRNLPDFRFPKQASINAFYYVTAFLRCRCQQSEFNVRERDEGLYIF